MCILFTTVINISFKICVKFINYKDFIQWSWVYRIYVIMVVQRKHLSSQSMFQNIMFTSLQGFKKSIQYDKCLNARDFCTYISYDSWHVINLYFMKLESENKYCTQTCTIVLKIIHVRCLIVKRDWLVSLPFITYLHKSYICMYISHIVIHHMCRGSPPPLLLLSKYLVSFLEKMTVKA